MSSAVKCKYLSNPNSPAVRKVCDHQKGCCEESCEIQSGGQEIAVVVG